nr:MAG TPA: hypothetical protein [Caudoviricetes sp.]
MHLSTCINSPFGRPSESTRRPAHSVNYADFMNVHSVRYVHSGCYTLSLATEARRQIQDGRRGLAHLDAHGVKETTPWQSLP